MLWQAQYNLRKALSGQDYVIIFHSLCLTFKKYSGKLFITLPFYYALTAYNPQVPFQIISTFYLFAGLITDLS